MNYITFTNPHDLSIPHPIIASLYDHHELAHIRKFDSVIYIILNYPYIDRQQLPLCVAVEDHSFTIYKPQNLDEDLNIPFETVAELILHILKQYENRVAEINHTLHQYEDTMEFLMNKSEIKKLFELNRHMIHYQTEINAMRDIVVFIETHKPAVLYNDSTAIDLTNIRIEINQLDQTINMYQEIISSLVDVSESLLTNKLNRIMQTLASITLILSIPTFVTSFYGMNIDLPFQDHPNALGFVFVISFLLTLCVVIFLRKKNYL